MLALLNSLLRNRARTEAVFDTNDQAKRFLAWADEGAYTPDHDGKFDIGGATSRALARLRDGVSPEAAGGTGERDNGNGSLMRILPLALVERDLWDWQLVEQATSASALTHGNPIAQATCALYLLIAKRLRDGDNREHAIGAALSGLGDVLDGLPNAAPIFAALREIESYTKRTGSGYVVDAFWSAWDAFAGAKDYRETIERAIRYGNDTDTTAAIAGGMRRLALRPAASPPIGSRRCAEGGRSSSPSSKGCYQDLKSRPMRLWLGSRLSPSRCLRAR